MAHRVVEHRVAGGVGELGEDDRVLVRERQWLATIYVTGDCKRQRRGNGRNHDPTRAWPPPPLIRLAGSTPGLDVPSQLFEVSANLRCVLIPAIAVGLETLRDDALQFRRSVDTQANGRHRPGTGRHFIEHESERPDVGAVIGVDAEGLLG